MSAKSGPTTMYDGTPCDECGGPTLTLKLGSIWCPAEDPHAGGHFVTRVAFERSPNKPAITPRRGAMTASQRASVIAERASDREAVRLLKAKPEPVKQPGFSGGYDDFVGSKEVK